MIKVPGRRATQAPRTRTLGHMRREQRLRTRLSTAVVEDPASPGPVAATGEKFFLRCAPHDAKPMQQERADEVNSAIAKFLPLLHARP
jgi:hypothetical protein